MLSDEEKKAIESLKEINQAIKYRPMFSIPSDTKLFDTILNLIEKQSKEIEELKEKNKSLIKERATEIVYVDRNFIRKDRIKPIQIIDLDGKIHNVYKIEEE